MTKLDLPTEKLRGALHCVSDKPTRYYLHGVYVEPADGGVCLSATDGYVLYHSRIECADAGGFVPFILPTDAIKLALRAAGARAQTIPLDTVARTVGAVSFTPIDGDFPDYRMIIPAVLSGEPAQYGPRVLTAAYKALGASISRGVLLDVYTNGDGPGVIGDPDGDTFVLVMPFRNAAAGQSRPGPKVAAPLAQF